MSPAPEGNFLSRTLSFLCVPWCPLCLALYSSLKKTIAFPVRRAVDLPARCIDAIRRRRYKNGSILSCASISGCASPKSEGHVSNESEGHRPERKRGIWGRCPAGAEGADRTGACSRGGLKPPSAGRRHESPENPEQVHAKSPIFWGLCDRTGACSVPAQYPPKVPEGCRGQGEGGAVPFEQAPNQLHQV